MNPDTRRCRLIAHTADLSALRGCSAIRIHLLMFIISPTWGDDASNRTQ